MKARSGLWWVMFALFVIAIDRFSKQWVIQHLNFGEPMVILPFFNFTLAYNTGAAFSFLHNASGWQNVFFITLAVAASGAILAWLYQHPAREWWPNFALAAIMGGALGNVWDRLTYGYVIDFLDFHFNGWHFAIFNVADSAICLGAIMMMFYWSRAR
jgi:signal peptidase II